MTKSKSPSLVIHSYADSDRGPDSVGVKIDAPARKAMAFIDNQPMGVLWTNKDLSIELGYSATGQALYIAARCALVKPYTMTVTNARAPGCTVPPRTRLWGHPEDISEAKKRGW